MKITSSILTCFLFAGSVIFGLGCGNQSENSSEENDSLLTEANNEATNEENQNAEVKSKLLVLIPSALEIGIPEGVNEKERKKGTSEDSLFFEVEMGVNPMDLEFGMVKNSAENLSLEQMEERSLFISDEGKTYEHESGKKYRSQWYALPYVMERKFRLTTYKDDNDYSTLEDDAKANGSITLKEGQTFSEYTNRYYIRLINREADKPRIFILVLELTVGC